MKKRNYIIYCIFLSICLETAVGMQQDVLAVSYKNKSQHEYFYGKSQ